MMALRAAALWAALRARLQPPDGKGIPRPHKQGLHIHPKDGVDQAGGDLRKGLQDKPAVGDLGMGNGQVFAVNHLGIVKEDVDVYFPGTPFLRPLLPMAVSMPSTSAKTCLGDKGVSTRRTWFRKEGWPVFPQAAVS